MSIQFVLMRLGAREPGYIRSDRLSRRTQTVHRRPILYKTTKKFLLRFALKDINELSGIEEFEKMAGKLAEQEEIPKEHHAPETPGEFEQEKDQSESPADGDDGDDTPAETVADKTVVDGRISGPPHNDNTDQVVDGTDSPALDAEIQNDQQKSE